MRQDISAIVVYHNHSRGKHNKACYNIYFVIASCFRYHRLETFCILFFHSKCIEEGVEATKLAEDLQSLLNATELSVETVVNILETLNDLQVKQLEESNKTSEEKLETATQFAEVSL